MPRQVIVVGSGAAGLAAAVAAATSGARVTVLEATSTIGGTTALSGGVAWVPANHRIGDVGHDDDRDRALTYLRGLALGDTDDAATVRFVDEGPRVLEALEAATPIRFRAIGYPDYHADRPGGLAGGRSVEPDPVLLPPGLDELVRPAVSWRVRATQDELIRGTFAPEIGAERERDGIQTMGRGLVAGLLRGALDAGAEVRTDERVTALLTAGDRVTGVRTATGTIDGRVVLATGGFERDPALVRTFLRAPISGLTGAPGSRGDGLRLALGVGASLGNMSEAWWAPTIQVPGAAVEGEPLATLLLTERGRPGVLLVDQRGRRFCDEAQNYNDVGRALHAFDPGGFRFERDPSWFVFDEGFRRRHPVGPVGPDDDDLDTWVHGDDAAALARAAGLPEATFVATLERYNEAAAAGRDDDFGRGDSTYDRFVGERGAPHPNLRPLSGRLTAVPVRAGTLGTKGGPRTDLDGRVRRLEGGVVPGLYAAGNAAASPLGMLYPGAGGTIGPALTFGHLAGAAAAADPR